MKISDNGIDLIKHYEGFRAEAYKDSVGIWTIGYGSTRHKDLTPVTTGEKINEQDALELLLWYCDVRERVMLEIIKQPLTQNRWDALYSFIYNAGMKAFEKSTLLKKINNNPDDPLIAGEFNRWIFAGDKKLPGLVARRKSESWLYFNNELKFDL